MSVAMTMKLHPQPPPRLTMLGSDVGYSSAQVFPLQPAVVRVIWPLPGVFIGGRTPDRER